MSMRLQSLSTAYGKTIISQDLIVEFAPGEFVGLVGPNGSGKSCLLKTIAQILPPRAGSIHFTGQSLATMNARSRARQIAYLAQDAAVSWPLLARDVIALGRAPYLGSLGRLSEQDVAAIDAAMVATRCQDMGDIAYNQLSGGEQARVALARALAVGGDVLLVDEPTNHLDAYYQLSVMDILRAQADAEKIVIAALHDLKLARRYCDRILVLDEGSLKADGPPDTALSDSILADIFRIQDGPHGFVPTAKL